MALRFDFTLKVLTVAVAVFCGLLSAEPAEATTIYVDLANCPGPGDVSQGNPFCKIQTAINAAVNGDTILVADGVYTGTLNKNLDFGGKLITLQSASGNAAACIIDCQGSGRGFYFHTGETAGAIVDGFTIRNGNATTSSPGGAKGAGVYCSGAGPSLTDCIISGNTATNATSAYGGGVCCASSSATLTNCTISGNAVTGSTSSYGGGVSFSGGNATLTDCRISDNRVTASQYPFGGGVYCVSSASPTLANCTISDNTATGPTAGSGGGVYSTSSSPKLLSCLIAANRAHSFGAGISCSSSALVLTNCTIAGNSAAISGGGVYSAGSTATPQFTNNILWGDVPQEIYVSSSTPVVTYCDVQGGYTGTGNINIDPGFAFIDEFHLMPGSPCIDAGTNTPPGGLPANDPEGNARPLDGNGDGQAKADLGAYEFNPAATTIAVSPRRIALYVPQGEQGQGMLAIRNAGTGVLHWAVSEDAFWLQTDPLQGESTGEIDTVTLTADATTLPHGTYLTALIVSDPEAHNTPRLVEVTLNVTATLLVPSQYTTIQAAIDATAGLGDQVLVGDGTYTGTGNKDLDFHGKAIIVRSASGNPAGCVIDCQGSGRGFYFHSGETAGAVVRDFTVQNGNASTGGGVYCYGDSNPTLVNCRILNNTATASLPLGGGLSCDHASPTLLNCVISGNIVDGRSTSSPAYGGGVYCSGSSPTLLGCSISNNSVVGLPDYSDLGGGGVFCDGSYLTLSNCTIDGNTARTGAGIRSQESSSLVLADCIIRRNLAFYDGGGVTSGSGGLTMRNCAISDNTACANGGGVYTVSSTSTLINCSIEGNKANSRGGALYFASDSLTLTNCTISGNTARSTGGALYCEGYSSTSQLTNCILWGDTPQEIYVSSGSPVVTYCDVQGGYTGTGNVNADPGLAFAEDFHLMPGSPCIDAGTNTPAGGLPTTDAEGIPRPVDGNGDGMAKADMGAAEFNPVAPRIAVDTARVELFVPEGEVEATTKTLAIRNAGGGTLNWTLSCEAGWLQMDPAQGASSGEIDLATLSVNVGTLPHGTYFTTLLVADPAAANNPRVVEVTLNVTRTFAVPGDYLTIQAAIDATNVPGDQVVMADGVYTGAGNRDLDFRGKPILVRSAGGDPATCIIDCQGGGRGFYFHSGETAASVVQGLTIRSGYVTGTSPGGELGGGVLCGESCGPTFIDCTISANTASYYAYTRGAGMYFGWYSTSELTRCRISGNIATGGYCIGGGLCSEGGMLTLRDCMISGNTITAAQDACGGAVYANTGTSLTLSNCVISDNRITGVRYVAGGGIRGYMSVMRLSNCTIARNTASGTSSPYGGGILSLSSQLEMTSCILWGDVPQEIYLDSGTATVSHSDIQGGYTGIGNINLDPLFADPDGPDNNPNTWQDNDYRLTAGSPCIDAGKNSAVPAGVSTDLDGHSRFVDDPVTPDCRYAPGTCGTPPIVDLGAYEYQLPVPGDLDGDYDVDGADFAVFLVAYGRCTGEPQYNPVADMNEDGCVTLVDYQLWLQAYRDFNGDPFAPPPQPSDMGDVNSDGAVNGVDVQPFVEVLLNPGGATMRERFVTDFTGDGQSDAADVAGFVKLLAGE